jgi:hypothetical protein
MKAAKEKRQVTYKGKSIRITADFSTQTLNARRSWKDIFQAQKESNCQPRLVYPAKLSFLAGCWWLMPVILATQEAKIRRIVVQSQPGQIVHKILSQKKNHKKGLLE